MSEKLDGMRCIWDGGITRGMMAAQVPWANIEKDGRYRNAPTATGLWSRYGNVIHAPNFFLDSLPDFMLDGELYYGRGNFQTCISIVKDITPGPLWTNMHYMVFDCPSPLSVFQDGIINNTNFKKTFNGFSNWYAERAKHLSEPGPFFAFENAYRWLLTHLDQNEHVKLHAQEQLPFQTDARMLRIWEKIKEVAIENNGEGLMLRKHTSTWTPKRTNELLKVKCINDAEGTVIGYTFGRETELGSKLMGLMGALILNFNGKIFELSGFTDDERRMTYIANGADAYEAGLQNPGQKVGFGIHNPKFPLGSLVTFRYRELTDAGIPKEAKYFRKPQ
jgi:DNA ligase-1